MLSLLPKPAFDRLNRLPYLDAMKIAQRKLEMVRNNRSRCPELLRTGQVSDREVADAIANAPVHFSQCALFRLGPIALTSTLTTNILNPGTTTGGTNCTSSPYGNLRVILTRIHIANKHASIAATFSLWVGGTGGNVAGTEIALGIAVPVGGEYNMDFPRGLVLDVADFLVGGSNTATALTLTAYGEITITK